MNPLNASFSDKKLLNGYSDVEMAGTDDLDSLHVVDFSSDDEEAPGAIFSEESMSSSSSLGDTPSSSPRSSRHFFLRQRNSTIQDYPTPTKMVNRALAKHEDAGFRSSFLLGPHTFESTLPVPSGPVRKGSDFDKHQSQFDSDLGDSIARLRTREQIVLHFLMELAMLRKDALVIIFGLAFQWVHNASTNFAYYYHTQLSAAQRIPLQDVAFQLLPRLTGEWWMASEYLLNTMIIIIVFLIAAIMVMRWNPPHGRPLYCIPIIRRMLITLVAAQTLRIISFLITTLPGSSRQCEYHVPENLTLQQMLHGPAPSEGNPQGWAPPPDIKEVFWRLDVLTGCGDLMFSSHTIFTCLFTCVVFQYFNWRPLKLTMVWIQILIVPLILAARKHYSIDVFTALYVTPLLFYCLKNFIPDMDQNSYDMAQRYGIRFYIKGHHYVVCMWGNEFYISPQDLPLDLQSRSRPLKTDVSTASELEPIIV